MIKFFFRYCFVLFFLNSNVFAVVFEAPDLKIVECAVQQLDDSVLVVFDVDNTLIVPTDLLLAPCGQECFQEFLVRLSDLGEKGEILASTITLQSQVSLVDEKILSLIAFLRQKNIKTIALTAISTGKFGLITNLEEWRLGQLRSLNIHFDWSFPNVEMTLNAFAGKKSMPVFKGGVLATAKFQKGKVLVEFLKKASWRPSKVIFVDDRLSFIESVEKELAKEGIASMSFHYTAASALPYELDMRIAHLQMDCLLQHGKWLSDAEAKEFLMSIPQ